jgi:hypothetical protein
MLAFSLFVRSIYYSIDSQKCYCGVFNAYFFHFLSGVFITPLIVKNVIVG